MITINEVDCTTIEEVEAQIAELSEEQKQFIRNDFYGIPNTPIQAIKPLSPRQLRLVLINNGIAVDAIDSVIDQLPEPDKSVAKVSWEYSVEFDRHHPLVDQVGAALGLTEEQIDAMFLEGIML